MTLSHLAHPSWPHLITRLRSATMAEDGRNTYAQYRRAIGRAGIVCPAAVLASTAAAESIRRRGIPVEVRSGSELTLAVSAGIAPSRIVMHGDGSTAGPLRCAVNAGVGQYELENRQQLAVLEHWARRPQRILIDMTTPAVDGLIGAALAADRIEMIGLSSRVDELYRYAGAIDEMVSTTARVRRESGVICTRLYLTTAGEPRGVGRAIEDALDESCARYRFPRPAVVLSLRGPGLRF